MSKLPLYNFHSHTYRCGHAFGEDEEYIQKAIAEGFKYYGVSDHVMFPFLDQKGTRGNFENDFDSYIKSINNLKVKYHEKLDLYLGMEIEYAESVDEYYKWLLNNHLDYLIMGQHFHMDDQCHFHSFSEYDRPGEMYVEDVIKGMKSGLVLYVAHPDQLVFYCNQEKEDLKALCTRIVKAAKETNTPLELNVSKVQIRRFAGEKDPEASAPFPLKMFWEIASKEQADVVVGLDCHKVQFACKQGFDYATELIKRYHLNVMTPKKIIKRMKDIKKGGIC